MEESTTAYLHQVTAAANVTCSFLAVYFRTANILLVVCTEGWTVICGDLQVVGNDVAKLCIGVTDVQSYRWRCSSYIGKTIATLHNSGGLPTRSHL